MFVPSNGSGFGGDAARPVPLPDGIVDSTPGPEAYALLAAVDVETISGYDTVEMVNAWSRQISRDRAMFLQAVLESGLRQPHSGETVARVVEPGEFASEEVRAALIWSRRRARDTFELAWDVHVRLPMLGQAMLTGELDEYRAQALATWTREIAEPHAEYICTELLPQAVDLTVGALIDHIKRLAIALDPEWARRRYEAAVAGRRVVGSRNPDGSADVAGKDLPVDRAKAGCDRIDILARSCKAAGDARKADHIRADLFLGMLDGTFTGMSEDEIVNHVVENPLVVDIDQGEDSDSGDDEPPRGSVAGKPEGSRQAAQPGRSESGEPEGQGRTGESSGSHAASRGARTVDSADSSGNDEHGQDRSDDEPDDNGGLSSEPRDNPGSGEPGGAACEPSDEQAWGVQELRVELTTLLGRDQHPGEIPPWGYVPAAIARSLLSRMLAAEWRFVICAYDGRPICSGITTRRPALPGGLSHGTNGSMSESRNGQRSGLPGSKARRGRLREGIVELQVRASDLSWLDAACAEVDCFPEWAQVIADIATRVGAGDVDTDVAADQVRRRFPTAGLRRLVEVRARYCTHPACRSPASSGDHDHVVEFAEGGRTASDNLHPPCRHDHRLRHAGQWGVSTSASGVTEWISPLGQIYATDPPPVMNNAPKPWSVPIMVGTTLPSARNAVGVASNRHKILDADTDEPPF